MTNIKYYVTCATHIDLAWKRNEEEMSEMITVLAVRLLDELERNPQFKYLLEQAYHYRALAVRRPDLVERLKYYVAQGRLEFMGAMASTLETNVPCGESFVRNQLLGMEWVKANFDVTVKTGWLMDTFGINAQVPQILKQFGISRLMANRFGGNKYQDVFYSVGLDGSRLLVVGRDVYSSYLRPGYVSEVCTRSWEDMDRLFRHAIEKTGDGPYMVTPMTENEMLVSFRPEYYIKEQNQKAGAEIWKYATPSEFLDALQTLEEQWPEEPGDLNPEFTATFSQRIPIRLQNRKAENLLIEAEKWALLTRLTDWKQQLEDAWWTMSYIHFHDVFTGSHPTNVFNTLMGKIYRVQQTSADILNKALNNVKEPGITTQDMISVKAFNGLPFERNDLIKVDLPSPDTFTTMVMCDGVSIPFETRDNQVLFRHTLPPVGCQTFELLQGSKPETFPQFSRVKAGAIENEFILLQCDETMGIVQLVNKKTGKQVLKNAKDLLVIQQDVGSFQIEQPVNAEVAFIAGGLSVEVCRNEGNSSRVRLSGRFPKLPWAGKDNKLQWTMEFSLYPGKEALYLKLDLDWVGEASRIRLKLPTCIDTAEAIYEVPFGTVRRKAYGTRATAKGEWPAQRFVTLQDTLQGCALINTGVPGVEVSGGTLWTTLLRAPAAEYSGMVADESSSQHGHHSYDFAVMPYSGHWVQANVGRVAQELNSPVMTYNCQQELPNATAERSFISLEPANLVLSSIKAPQDGSDELVIRFYESAGQDCQCTLVIDESEKVWKSDLAETKGEELEVVSNCIKHTIMPFEIITLRVKLMS